MPPTNAPHWADPFYRMRYGVGVNEKENFGYTGGFPGATPGESPQDRQRAASQYLFANQNPRLAQAILPTLDYIEGGIYGINPDLPFAASPSQIAAGERGREGAFSTEAQITPSAYLPPVRMPSGPGVTVNGAMMGDPTLPTFGVENLPVLPVDPRFATTNPNNPLNQTLGPNVPNRSTPSRAENYFQQSGSEAALERENYYNQAVQDVFGGSSEGDKTGWRAPTWKESRQSTAAQAAAKTTVPTALPKATPATSTRALPTGPAGPTVPAPAGGGQQYDTGQPLDLNAPKLGGATAMSNPTQQWLAGRLGKGFTIGDLLKGY